MRWQLMATTWLQVLHARSINRAGNYLPCGTGMGYLRERGSPCPPLYSQTGVSTPSFVPTSLRTTRDSYRPMLRLFASGRRKTNLFVPIYLLCLTQRRRLQALGGGGIPQTSPTPVESLLRATPAGVLAPPGGILPPHQGTSNTEDRPNTTRPLILLAAQWSLRPIAPASQHTFCAQCSTKNVPPRWTRYPWGWFSPGCPPPYYRLNAGSPEHAGLREPMPLKLRLTVEALYSQPPLFSNLPGAVSTLVLTARPTPCVPRQVQDSCRAPVMVNVLTPGLNQVRHSRHLHIRCLWSCVPGLAVPCSPMPVVTSLNQMAAYQVCSHPASVCLDDHVVHGICPNVMTLGSQRRAVAFYSRGK